MAARGGTAAGGGRDYIAPRAAPPRAAPSAVRGAGARGREVPGGQPRPAPPRTGQVPQGPAEAPLLRCSPGGHRGACPEALCATEPPTPQRWLSVTAMGPGKPGGEQGGTGSKRNRARKDSRGHLDLVPTPAPRSG